MRPEHQVHQEHQLRLEELRKRTAELRDEVERSVGVRLRVQMTRLAIGAKARQADHQERQWRRAWRPGPTTQLLRWLRSLP